MNTLKTILDIVKSLLSILKENNLNDIWAKTRLRINQALNVIKKYTVSILVIGVVSLAIYRLVFLYNNLLYDFKLRNDIPVFYTQLSGFKLSLITLALGVLCILLVYSIWKSWGNKQNNVLNTIMGVIGIIVSFYAVLYAEISFTNLIQSDANSYCENTFYSGNYGTAIDICTTVSDASVDPLVKRYAAGLVAGAYFRSGNPKASIEEYAKLIFRDGDIVHPEDITSLHWAIYNLVHDSSESLTLEEAELYLKDIYQKYPTKELSPIWLGINPDDYATFMDDKVRLINVSSANDRNILRVMISTYPDDKYVDLARLLLGEHRQIADTGLTSPVRDWALYKSGQEAYYSGEYETAIYYYEAFLKEFRNHRWADDAAYRLARSFQLIGDYESALTIMLEAIFLPDGDMEAINRSYTIALIDVFFSSKDLEQFIEQRRATNQPPYQLAILDYSLAEQLMKEGLYFQAKDQFEKVAVDYPGTFAASLVPKNIEILEKLISFESLSVPDSLFETAKYLIAEPADMGVESLIIYNDLYAGSRATALVNIGDAANWDYFVLTNDHFRAATSLEDFAFAFPTHPRTPEALYLASIAYYNLTFGIAFIPFNITGNYRIQDYSLRSNSFSLIRERLGSLSNQLLQEYPNSEYAPLVFELAGIAFAGTRDYEQATRHMSRIFELHPSHNLANNALIYVARLYVARGNESSDDIYLQRVYYRAAREHYEKILASTDYSLGHVGNEAKQELTRVDQLLSEVSQP